jgi:hypothetical protein
MGLDYRSPDTNKICNEKDSVRGGGLGLCGEHIQELYSIHCVFDQIPNLQNCFTTPKQKPRRGGGLRWINTCRQRPFTGQFLRKVDI